MGATRQAEKSALTIPPLWKRWKAVLEATASANGILDIKLVEAEISSILCDARLRTRRLELLAALPRSLFRYLPGAAAFAREEHCPDAALDIVERQGTRDLENRILRAAILTDLRRLSEAEGIVSNILARYPNNLSALDALDRLLCLDRRWSESLVVRRQIASLTPSMPSALRRLGEALLRVGRQDLAEDAYLAAAGMAPDDAESLCHLGSIAFWNREPVVAQDFLRRAIVASPHHAESHRLLASIHLSLGNRQESLSAYDKCLEMVPHYYPAFEALLDIEGGRAVHSSWARHLDFAQKKPEKSEKDWRFIASALIASGNIPSAMDNLDQAISCHGPRPWLLLLMAHAHRLLGQSDQAVHQLDRLLDRHRYFFPAYDERIQALCGQNKFDEARCYFEANLFYFDSAEFKYRADGILRQLHLGSGHISLGLSAFRYSAVSQTFVAHLSPPKAALSLASLPSGAKILILGTFGIGDEIAWCHIFEQLAGRHTDIAFTCDPRLVGLFQRSFPRLHFIPTRRWMETTPHATPPYLSEYTALPNLALARIVNNVSWMAVERADHAALAVNLLADLIPERSSLSPTSTYLVPDPDKVHLWKRALRAATPGFVVGFSWTSLRITHHRRIHLTDLEDWRPLFDIPGVTFVCLDPAATAETIRTFSKRAGTQILLFPDLNLKDDIDAVAALVKAVDLVITVGNSIGELASAVGTPTWILSRSHAFKWRTADDGHSDLIRPNREYIQAVPASDIDQLMASAAVKLQQWVALNARASGKKLS